MALIKCPECKKKISDQCENCPQCGYPINKICETDEGQSANFENVAEITVKNKKSFGIKSLIKKWWFLVTVGVVIAAITTTTILLLNRDTKPKFDKEGNPVFVELTNEVYTNAKKHKGYHINIKGQVFQVLSDNGNVKGIQIWLDPDTCEQNVMIYYNTDVEVKQGDYIMCSGYIDSITEYKNAYDAKLYAPLVISSDLVKATYIDVMSPTTATITPENLIQEKYGYSISIEKIEFAEKETRVYATAKNNGKALLNIGDAVIVQNGKQYNSKDNYEADYDELPYELIKGASSSGIITFPALSTNDFTLTISIYSDDYEEKTQNFVFNISKSISSDKSPQEGTIIEKNEIKTEKTDPTKNSSNDMPSIEQNDDKNETPIIDKNQEAIEMAEIIINELDAQNTAVSPSMAKKHLKDIYGFSEEQATYGVNNANINWNFHAVNCLEDYIFNNEGASKNNAKKFLNEKGYYDNAIQFALSNASIDWEEQIQRYIDKLNQYIDYSWCNNCGAVYGVYTYCPFCNGSVSIQGDFGYTKEEVVSKLKAEGFTDVEINNVLGSYSDEFFYDESKYKKP